jgi:hypothetical protein
MKIYFNLLLLDIFFIFIISKREKILEKIFISRDYNPAI